MSHHGGKLLVACLQALGAKHSFGVPGESYLAVLDALHDTQGAFDFTLCRNEGGASFMAAAYGKLTRSPGICFVTRGPGVTNASIGIHTAQQDSAPMIVFVGQVATTMKGREAFQEIDYKAMFGTVAKWAVEIEQVERIPEIVARAWKTATTGRPGPVVVALPEDVLSAQTDVTPLVHAMPVFEPAPPLAALEQVKQALSSALKPVLLYGGCNWSTEGQIALERFAQSSNIPVLSVFRYQDQFDNTLTQFCGEAGVGMLPWVKEMLSEADVILAINNRFGENSTDGYTLFDLPKMRQTLIHVHASDQEIGKIYQPDVGIHAGPNAFATALAELDISGPWADWTAHYRAAYETNLNVPHQPSPVDMGHVMAYLQAHLPEDVIITNGAGNFAIWPNKQFKFGKKARLLAPQSGAMGYGIPAAIAAKISEPEKTVVCFAGDGDFQMNCQELATAAQAGACPIVLILNNGIYGTIRAHQERNYPERVSGTTMVNPDFAALARSYGFHGERVDTTEQFAQAFERALASPSGAVLDLNISPEALTPRVSLSQMRAAGLTSQN